MSADRHRKSTGGPLGTVTAVAVARWRSVLVLGSTALMAVALLNELLKPGRPTLSADSALYMHGGWYMLNGGVPYVDIWDVKPPLAFELPAILSLFSLGDPTVMYALSVVTTAAATCGIVLVVGTLVQEVTGDDWAALVAGVATFAFPFLFYYPAKGFRPKSFVFLFGFLSLLLALRDRPLVAGALAAASAGLWQLAVIFPLLALGIVVRRGKSVVRAFAGAGAVTVAVTLPIVALGGGEEMLVGAVLIPLTDAESASLAYITLKAVVLFGAGVPVVLGGIAGLVGVTRRDPAAHWWLAVGGAWFAFQVLIDLDYFPDLFGLYLFAAIGLGGLVASDWSEVTGEERGVDTPVLRLALLGVLGVLIVSNGVLGLAVGPAAGYNPIAATDATAEGLPGVTVPEDEAFPDRYGPYYDVSQGEYMNDLYWNQQIPPYCHYRFATSEKRWLQRTGSTYDSPCGTVPPGFLFG